MDIKGKHVPWLDVNYWIGELENLLVSSIMCNKKYVGVIENMSPKFEVRFSNFIAKEDMIKIFTAPFNAPEIIIK